MALTCAHHKLLADSYSIYYGTWKLVLDKDQTSLLTGPLQGRVLDPKKDTQLKRHVEAWQSRTWT